MGEIHGLFLFMNNHTLSSQSCHYICLSFPALSMCQRSFPHTYTYPLSRGLPATHAQQSPTIRHRMTVSKGNNVQNTRTRTKPPSVQMLQPFGYQKSSWLSKCIQHATPIEAILMFVLRMCVTRCMNVAVFHLHTCVGNHLCSLSR